MHVQPVQAVQEGAEKGASLAAFLWLPSCEAPSHAHPSPPLNSLTSPTTCYYLQLPSKHEAQQSASGTEAQQQALTLEEANFVRALDTKLADLVRHFI